MKKSKALKKVVANFFVATFFVLTFINFSSCKTLSNFEPTVKTFDLLDDEGALYIHIPASENQEILQQSILAFSKKANKSSKSLNDSSIELDKNSQKAISKIENLYASIGSRKNKKRFQIALDTSDKIPSIAKSLLDKNDFFENAVVSKNQLVMSQDVSPMIDLYNSELKNSYLQNLNDSLQINEPFRADWKSTDLYNWITEDVSSIRFYIVRPQSFLTNLIGADISTKLFKLVYAKGDFKKLPNTKYELTLDLEFSDTRLVRPAISILILTLGLTDSEIIQTSTSHIQVKGVHLSASQLIKMFGI